MDPNEKLLTILERGRKIRAMDSANLGKEESPDSPIVVEALQLADDVDELHEWLSKGGFVPAAWATGGGPVRIH